MGVVCGDCVFNEDAKFALHSPFKCVECGSSAATVWQFVWPKLFLLAAAGFSVWVTIPANTAPSAQPTAGDVFKLLALFVQYFLILGSLPVPWPPTKYGLFTSTDWLWGTGSTGVSPLECILSGAKVPPAALKLLVQLCMPFFVSAIMLAVFTCVHYCRCCGTQAGNDNDIDAINQQCRCPVYIPVVLLVCAFLTFPAWVHTSFSFFGCQNIQDPTLQYSLWWVQDMGTPCYTGYHKTWGLKLGLPCLVLCCLAPVALFVGLALQKSKLSEPGFQARYGSVYHLYEEHAFYWEAVIWAQTIALVALSVFATQIGKHSAVLLSALHLALSLLLLQCFRPYSASLLHRTHVASTCCLLLNVFVALLMFSEPSGPSQTRPLWVAQVAAACFALVVSCGFVVACAVFMVKCFIRSPTWEWVQGLVVQLRGYMRSLPSQLKKKLARGGGGGGGDKAALPTTEHRAC
jgi:hypothetical protein